MSNDERTVRFSMCAGEVTLDLVQMKEVASAAIGNARNELSRTEGRLRDLLERAYVAELKGETHEHYLALCNANTERQYLERYARQYAEAIQAYFYLSEAIKRDTVKVIME